MFRVSKENFRINLPAFALALVGGLTVGFGASRGVSAENSTLLPDLAPHRLSACWLVNLDDGNFVDVRLRAGEINLGEGEAGVHGAVVKVMSRGSGHMWRDYPAVSSLGPGETAVLEERVVGGRSFGGDGWTIIDARDGKLYVELAVDAYGVGIPESDESNNFQTLDPLPRCLPKSAIYIPSIMSGR